MNVVRKAKNRETGTTIEVIDNRDGSFEAIEDTTHPEEMRWVTLCDEHGDYCLHSTRKLAEWFAADPISWCYGCEQQDDERRALARETRP